MNKNLVKLLAKIGLLAGLVVATFAVLRFIYLQKRANFDYLAALNDKHAYLKKQHSPRLILLGGSNFLFGINSDSLQKYVEIPVVNMALLAPLGVNFMMADLEKDLRKDDIVLLSFEYDIAAFGDADALLSASDFYNPSAESLLTNDDFRARTKAFSIHQINILRNLISLKSTNFKDDKLVYFRKAFSAKGDIVSHLNKPPKPFDSTLFPKDSIDFKNQITVMNKYIQRYKTKGAKVYFVYTTLSKNTYHYGLNAIKMVENQLNKNLQCPIITKPDDFIYADSLYFDSFYHLQAKSRDLRTKTLFLRIKSAILNLKN